MPAHRRKDIPLREKEKQVMSLFMQGISGSDMTVVELVERYISLKSGVKLSDAKMFLISLQRSGFVSANSVDLLLRTWILMRM